MRARHEKLVSKISPTETMLKVRALLKDLRDQEEAKELVRAPLIHGPFGKFFVIWLGISIRVEDKIKAVLKRGS